MWSVTQPPPDSAQGQPSPGCELWGSGMVAPVCPPHMAGVLGQWADTDTLGAMVSLPQSPSTMMAPYVVSLSEVMVFSTSTHSTALATNILVDNLCGLSSSPRSFHTCIVTPESQIPSTMMANADFCGLSNECGDCRLLAAWAGVECKSCVAWQRDLWHWMWHRMCHALWQQAFVPITTNQGRGRRGDHKWAAGRSKKTYTSPRPGDTWLWVVVAYHNKELLWLGSGLIGVMSYL